MKHVISKILSIKAKFPNYPVVIYPTTGSKIQFNKIESDYEKCIGCNWTVYHFSVPESLFHMITHFDTKIIFRDKYFLNYNHWGSELCKLRYELHKYISKEDSFSMNLVSDFKHNTVYKIEKYWPLNLIPTAAVYAIYGPYILLPDGNCDL
jgi:hypothetical protein